MAVASVIGASGQMGNWFTQLLKANRYKVIIYDKNRTSSIRQARRLRLQAVDSIDQAIRASDLVVLATPTDVTAKILKQLDARKFRGKVLVEISSVKEPVRRWISKLANSGMSIISIHPIFGPSVKSLSGKTIMVTAAPRGHAAADSFLSMLRKRGARIMRCSYDTHDRYVSLVLTIPHLVNIAMVNTLRVLQVNPNRLLKMAGPRFKLQMVIAETVYQEALNNELSILMSNKYSRIPIKEFADQTALLRNLTSANRKSSLLRELRLGGKFIQRSKTYEGAYQQFMTAAYAANLA